MSTQTPGKELASVTLVELPQSPFTQREQIRSVLVRFGRGLLHDLNNPAGAMSGYTEMIAEQIRYARQSGDTLDADRLASCIEGLQQCILRLAEIMDQARHCLRPDVTGVRAFSPEELASALMNQTDEEFRLLILGAEGFSSNSGDLSGFCKLLASGIREMARELARTLGKKQGILRSRLLEGANIPAEHLKDLPPEMADGRALEIDIGFQGGALTPEEVERMFFPLNLRTPGATGGGGWGFATGYTAIRAHGGGVTLADTPEGIHLMIYLPLQGSGQL